MNHFSIGLWHVMKSGFYATTSDDQLSAWSDKKLQRTPQRHTYTNKRSWSLKFSEFEWNNYIWEVYSTNWWDAPKSGSTAAGIGRQNGPNSPWQHPTACCTTYASKDESIVPQSFASFTMLTWPLANWRLLLQVSQKLFAGKILPHPAGGRKCFPRVHLILKHEFFMLQE